MIKRVEKYVLSDGSLYTGNYDDYEERPMGAGYCSYPDGHEALGTFIGIPNGVAYVNYISWMELGYFCQGKLQGWGMQMGNGHYHFGVFHSGTLIKDCTILFENTHTMISKMSRSLREKGLSVRWARRIVANNSVFFGVCEKGYKKVGLRFYPSGDVYIGMSDSITELTGTFVHLFDSSIESGVFEKGQLILSSPHVLLHSEYWTELLHTKEVSFNSDDLEAFEIAKITRHLVAEYL